MENSGFFLPDEMGECYNDELVEKMNFETLRGSESRLLMFMSVQILFDGISIIYLLFFPN